MIGGVGNERRTLQHDLPAPGKEADIAVADFQHIALALRAVEVKGNEPYLSLPGLAYKARAGALVDAARGGDDEVFQNPAADIVLGEIHAPLELGGEQAAGKGMDGG